MEIKQRGNALGYKLLLILYRFFGYRFVSFILNFVALYYVFFTPTVKSSLGNYYKHQQIPFNIIIYFKHIKNFALAILDRFISRINFKDLSFQTYNEELIKLLENGGIVLLSHVGSWASAAHSLNGQLQKINIVMKENTQSNIQNVEKQNKRFNEESVNIIDLNNGFIPANIQIANALINKELVAMMVDRVNDKNKAIEVNFFNEKVNFNKTPFEIAMRMDKPLMSIFVMRTNEKEYNIYLDIIKMSNIEDMAQGYANLLEKMVKQYPDQWYNFYDFFEN